MNNEYNSILNNNKETKLEKFINNNNNNSSKPNYALIGIFVCILIVIIYYIIYFNTVLSGKNIIKNDFKLLKEEYQNIFKNINFNYDTKNDFYIDGNIKISNNNKIDEIKYNLNKNNSSTQLTTNKNNDTFLYYSDSKNNYIKWEPLSTSYVQNNNITLLNYINSYNNIQTNLNTWLSEKQEIKKSFYMQKEKPLIKIEFNMDSNDLYKITNLNIKDKYKINVTLINNAITDKIESIKIIINNNTKKTRTSLTYKDKYLIYTNNDGEKIKYSITNKDKNFELKIYKNDLLHSVLSGKHITGEYNYTYQIIDKSYTLKFSSQVNNNKFIYNFVSLVNMDNKKYDLNIILEGHYNFGSNINNLEGKYIKKSNLTDTQKEKYNNILKDILGFDLKDLLTID